ncbi:hypothetical protein FKM82_007931 [Ascaphus truei]
MSRLSSALPLFCLLPVSTLELNHTTPCLPRPPNWTELPHAYRLPWNRTFLTLHPRPRSLSYSLPLPCRSVSCPAISNIT